MFTRPFRRKNNRPMSSKRITLVLGAALVIAFAYVGYMDAVRTWQDLQAKEQQVETLNEINEELDIELNKTLETKEKSQAENKKLEQEKRELEEERKRLEAELQAKIEARTKLAAASQRVISTATNTETVSAAPVGGGARSGCGDNQYAAYIYGQESGGRVTGNCDPSAVNEGGCRGIGQACPGGKLPCGADYACQNAWFTQYAMSTYGSWASAYNFHKAKGWW